MQTLSEHQLLNGLVAISSILLFGRGTAEIAKRFNQPEVLGELIGGFILGPSVLGVIFPGLYHHLFGDSGVGLALSMFAWTGAILLLVVAGAEVDLSILTQHRRAGLLAAIFTIVPSILLGTALGQTVLSLNLLSSVFFGAVLSVTAVSVVAKIFIERKTLRRGYAQVILAAGIASEVAVWPVISVLSALHSGEHWSVGLRTTLFAVLFFAFMLTIGQTAINWVMRRMADVSTIIYGQLSLLVVLGFFFAEITEVLGLHPLLGPFVFGILVGRAPRATSRLKESIHSMSLSVFAPVFFVTAGMRVDITKLTNHNAFILILVICLSAMATKVLGGLIGGKLGGLRFWESILVGVGANTRGGTDVIVAILGGSLGIISESVYSMYAIAAILTVFISPPIIAALEKRVPPSAAELERLSKEAAKKRAYLSGVERILLPTLPELYPAACVPLLSLIAQTKERENEVFDIAEMAPESHTVSTSNASTALKELEALKMTEHNTLASSEKTTIEAITEGAKTCDLIVMGSSPQANRADMSFGHLQDDLINSLKMDMLIVANGKTSSAQKISRILVPVNGMEYSMAAADIAAYIAKASDAELTLLHVVSNDKQSQTEVSEHAIQRVGLKVLKEVKFRIRRLNVQTRNLIVAADNPSDEVFKQIKEGKYDLVMMGLVNRSAGSALNLGKTAERLRLETNIQAGILIVSERSEEADADS